MKDVGWIKFREDGSAALPAAIHARSGLLEWSMNYAYEVPPSSGTGIIELLSDSYARDTRGYDPPIAYKYSYPGLTGSSGEVRIFSGDTSDSTENYDTDAKRTLINYTQRKAYNIASSGSNVTASIWNSAGNNASISRGDIDSAA